MVEMNVKTHKNKEQIRRKKLLKVFVGCWLAVSLILLQMQMESKTLYYRTECSLYTYPQNQLPFPCLHFHSLGCHWAGFGSLLQCHRQTISWKFGNFVNYTFNLGIFPKYCYNLVHDPPPPPCLQADIFRGWKSLYKREKEGKAERKNLLKVACLQTFAMYGWVSPSHINICKFNKLRNPICFILYLFLLQLPNATPSNQFIKFLFIRCEFQWCKLWKQRSENRPMTAWKHFDHEFQLQVFGCSRCTCIHKGFDMAGHCYCRGLLMRRCLIMEDAFQYKRYPLTTKVQ